MNELLRKLPYSIKRQLAYYLYRMEGMFNRLRFISMKVPSNGWPTLLGISFPKSGTHLLEQIMLGFSKIAPFTPHIPLYYAGVHYMPRRYSKKFKHMGIRQQNVAYITSFLNTLRPLDISKGHLPAMSEIVEQVCSPKFIPFFIFRDLRDTAVSSVFYLTDMDRQHRLHQYYKDGFKTFDERLTASIRGFSFENVRQPDIATRFERYTAWFDYPQIHKVRFEDLIHDQNEALGLIVDHFCQRVDTVPATHTQIIAALRNNIDPKKSPTFRSGKTGSWKRYFTDEHKNIFKEVAGDLLIRLGYEKDNSW